MNNVKNKKGFTLTEIMTVVLIIGILAAIAYPMYTRAILKARMAEAISLMEIVRTAQQRYITVNNNGYFPKFTNAHITGDTRILKSREATSIQDGKSLKKGLYLVTLKNPKGTFTYAAPHSCIEIAYGEDSSNPVFKIQGLVEDSIIYCWEQNSQNGICHTFPDDLRQTNTICAGGGEV